MKKAARLIFELEKCREIINDDIIIQNKTLIKKIENCKPFIGVNILFVSVSIILSGKMIYFKIKK